MQSLYLIHLENCCVQVNLKFHAIAYQNSGNSGLKLIRHLGADPLG